MASELFSLDRVESDLAVLLDDNGTECIVPLSTLPVGACTGKMYRLVDGVYEEDPAAEQERRARIQALQNRLRRRPK